MMKIPASLWQRLLPLLLFALLLNASASLANSSLVAPKNEGYISEISGDGFYAWNRDRFPLRVYLQPVRGLAGYKETYPEVLRSCFDDWARVSEGKLSWKQVDSEKEADIVVTWSNEVMEAARRLGTISRGMTFVDCLVIKDKAK